MRVISGKFKGLKLFGPKGDGVRPTTDRVKESLFNIIGERIVDTRVLDLFSGTGSLSLESLSRGASYIECVELNKSSIDIIRKNIEKAGLEKSDFLIRKQDVFKYLKGFSGEPFDIVFIDPPFTQKWADRVLSEISLSKTLKKESLVVIESTKHEQIEESYGSLVRIDSRNYSDKLASIFEYQ